MTHLDRAAVRHYFNGQWVSEDRLLIPVSDLSVARGFGVFDFLRTYGGKPFRLEAHIARFVRSAGLVGLELPVAAPALTAIVEHGLATNPPGEYAIRMTLTGGHSADFMTPERPSLIVAFYEVHPPTPEQFAHGVKVITTAHVRHLPEAKSLNYLAGVIAVRAARQQGAFESIYTDQNGQLYEGTTTNIFAVRDGVILTPAESILKGITRETVFELADKLGISYRQTPLNVDQLGTFQEMFITSSSREILPVMAVDGQAVGDGHVGPVARQLKQVFEKLVG